MIYILIDNNGDSPSTYLDVSTRNTFSINQSLRYGLLWAYMNGQTCVPTIQLIGSFHVE